MIDIEKTLININRQEFDKVEQLAKDQLINLNSNQRVRDAIFQILRRLENIRLLRFPIDDQEITAFKIRMHDKIYVYINSAVPLEKQIFGGAHELYHILYESCHTQEDFLDDYEKSYTNTKKLDEMSANSFAACFLVPKEQLKQEVSNISNENIELMDIIRLMETFAVPYKTIVLRLFECEIITKEKAEEFLEKEDRNPEKDVLLLINQTHTALQWQRDTKDSDPEYGNLIELAVRNYKEKIINVNNINSDFKSVGIENDINDYLEK